jgi:hypothetical protein
VAVNTRKPSEGPLDQPITEEVVNYYTSQLAKARPDLDPNLLRRYTLFYLSGKDVGDITNESLGFINNVLNPQSFRTPNLANTKETDEYFFGVVGGPMYRQIYDQAFEAVAPTWRLTEREIKTIPKNNFSFRRAVQQAIKGGATPQSLNQLVRDTNAAVASDASYREKLKKAGLSTPFDNLTTEDAIKFINVMYNEYYDARNAFSRVQTNYLQNDPYFKEGLPDPKFKYGLETNYTRGEIKHPMADIIKPRAEETALAITKANFPGVAPEIISPTDVPERKGTVRTKVKTQFGSLAGKEVNPRELKSEAFKTAAKQYLNITLKDAEGKPITDPTTNQPIRITPLEDAIAGRLIVGTNVRK